MTDVMLSGKLPFELGDFGSLCEPAVHDRFAEGEPFFFSDAGSSNRDLFGCRDLHRVTKIRDRGLAVTAMNLFHMA